MGDDATGEELAENFLEILILQGPDGDEQEKLMAINPVEIWKGINLEWTSRFMETTDYTLLMWASHYNKETAVDVLLKLGADPTVRNNFGANVLQMMAKRGQYDMIVKCSVHVFRQYGENVHLEWIRNGNNNGWTPFHASLQGENLQSVNEFLLTMGADPLAEMNYTGWTVLHVAASKQDSDTQEMIFRVNNMKSTWKKMFAKTAVKGGVTHTPKDLDEKFLKDMTEKLQIEKQKIAMDMQLKKSDNKNSFRALIVLVTLADIYEPVFENVDGPLPRNTFKPKNGYKKYNDGIIEQIRSFGIEVDIVTYDRARWNTFEKFIAYLKDELGKQGRPVDFYGVMMWVVTAHGLTCTQFGGDIFNIYDDSQSDVKQTKRRVLEKVCVFQHVVDKFLPTSRENKHIARTLEHLNQFFFFECCRELADASDEDVVNKASSYARPSHIGSKS